MHHAQVKWEDLHDSIMQQNIDANVTVQIMYFEKEEYMAKQKNGEIESKIKSS